MTDVPAPDSGGCPPDLPEAWQRTTSLPCPAWCGRDKGHGFDDDSLINPGLLRRDHEADIGTVWVAADEYAVGPEGPLWQQDEPRVYLDKQDGLDVAQARALAQNLLEAAELIEAAEGSIGDSCPGGRS